MARDYKLNKSELTRLKREHKLFNQFLPVLKLKMEQLQLEQIKLKRTLKKQNELLQKFMEDSEGMTPALANQATYNFLKDTLVPHTDLGSKSIAGVMVPTLESITFKKANLSYFGTSPNIIRSIPVLENLISAKTKARVLQEQNKLISKELKKATQKVNLFEKVLIPKTDDAIKRIRIALGDEQVAQVGRSKIAKRKSA